MYTRPTAPQEITGVLDDAFRLFLASLKTVLPLSFLASVITALPQAAITLMGINPETADFSATLAIVGIGVFIITLMAGIVLWAALLLQMDAFAKGQTKSLGDAVMGGLPFFLPLLVAFIVYTVGLVIGLILLIIPGIILAVYWLQFMPAAVLERAGPIGCLTRSYQLIRGSWWRTAILYSVWGVIIGVVYSIVIVFVIGGIIGTGIAADELDTTTTNLLDLVIGPILSTFILPFGYAFMLAIHHDLVMRKEGGDLAARINNVVSA